MKYLFVLAVVVFTAIVVAAFALGINDYETPTRSKPTPSQMPGVVASPSSPPEMVITTPLYQQPKAPPQQPGIAASPAVTGVYDLPVPAGPGA